MMGVGLAVAVLIDATLVRAVLLPAAMKLLGDRNWYLPKRLHWLPKFEPRAAGRAREGVASPRATRRRRASWPCGARVTGP